MSELRGLNVWAWPWGLLSSPKSISCTFGKHSTTVAFAIWQHILSISIDRVSLHVIGWAWTLLYGCESFGCWIDYRKRRISVLWDWESASSWFHVEIFMSSRPWCLFISEFGLNEVNRLGSSCEAVVINFLLFILVLIRWWVTAPGPGIFCIWGMR